MVDQHETNKKIHTKHIFNQNIKPDKQQFSFY